MGRYMTVVLKKRYRNDKFIINLNEELSQNYGANTGIKFNTLAYLKEEADYMNTDPKGLKLAPHWKRPITPELLHINCHWLRFGEFSFKLSAPETSTLARDAVAVCKWVAKTNGKYIVHRESKNYSVGIVRQYLDWLFTEIGYDLKHLWKGHGG